MNVRWKVNKVSLFSLLALVLLGLLPAGSFAFKGGADEYGYYYIDSKEDGGPKYAWEDLEKTGTEYNGFDKPEIDYPNSMGSAVGIGFDFNFYGKKYRDVYLAGNGYIAFASDDYSYRNYVYNGSGIPSNFFPTNIIAPFWGWNDTYS